MLPEAEKNMNNAVTLSIVVPCFNEEKALDIFHPEITRVCAGLGVSYGVVYVNDGSSDATLQIMRELSAADSHVRYVSFSRNFGKEAALLAGLETARGDYVVTMDVDMQDPPALIPEMFKAVTEEGFDCAATRRVTRKGEPPIRSFFARKFYRIMNRISDANIVDGARDFRLMKRSMVDAILSLTEKNRFSKGIFSWVGFSTKWFEYENIERAAGETKWSFWKLLKYSLDGITAFSTTPLSVASFMGFFFSIIAFVFIVVIIVRTLVWGDPVSGWPSLVSIVLLLGGVQLLSIGIVGKYLAKTYIEVKNRPLYIVKETSDEQK